MHWHSSSMFRRLILGSAIFPMTYQSKSRKISDSAITFDKEMLVDEILARF